MPITIKKKKYSKFDLYNNRSPNLIYATIYAEQSKHYILQLFNANKINSYLFYNIEPKINTKLKFP